MDRLDDAVRGGWLSFLTGTLGVAVRAPQVPRMHVSGPAALRVLLVGGGAAVGMGVSRQEVGLPGHLARHLAAISRRGVDLDIAARLGMTIAGARREIGALDLAQYDVLVLSLGVGDALAGLPVRAWRGELELLLAGVLSRAPVHARIVAIGAHRSSWSPYFNRRLTGYATGRADDFNAVTRELCWALPRTSYLAAVTKGSSDETPYAVRDYERLGRVTAAHIAKRLDQRLPLPPEAEDAGDLAGSGLTGLPGEEVIDRVLARVRSAFGVEGAELVRARPPGAPGSRARTRSSSTEALHEATAAEPGGLAVKDLRAHPAFRDSSLVRRHDMAFYAGHPVRDPAGECVAVLTVFDPRPRTVSAQEMGVLRNHAVLIEDALALPARDVEAPRGTRRAAPRAAVLDEARSPAPGRHRSRPEDADSPAPAGDAEVPREGGGPAAPVPTTRL